MDQQILKELEVAAKILLAPPHVVTNQQRQAAESVFVNFKRTKSPYMLCRYILEQTRVDYVLFEVAGLLREALIREWKLLQKSDVISLAQYLLHYVTDRVATLPLYVREKILQVLAIIAKRGSAEDEGAQRGVFLTEIENLIMNGDQQRQLLGCSMISALVQEHAITPKSSDIGLTLKQNFEVKEQFEMSDLKKIFQFCCRALSNLSAVQAPIPEETVSVVKQLLSISEAILTWNFTISARFLFSLNYDTCHTPKLKLPHEWKDAVLDNNVVNLFFTVYLKVRTNPQLFHHGMTCLIQLATLQGAIFESEESRRQYFNTYVESFVKLIQNAGVLDREALGISNVFREVMLFLPDVLLPGLPGPLLQAFLEQMTEWTCTFAEGAATEETICADDRLYMDAFDFLMESWLNALTIQSEVWQKYLLNATIQIFSVYLKCHLAPPEGTRGEGRDAEQEDFDETEESDRHRFRDQLQNIGEFARRCPEYSIPLLSSLLEARTKKLATFAERLRFERTSSLCDSGHLFLLFEDLNWLLLIAANVISYESTEIPADLMKYSLSQFSSTSIDVTLQVFGSPNNTLDEFPDAERCTDPVVRLVAAVFRLGALYKKFMEIKMVMFLSPEMISSSLWFFKLWANSYLMFDEQINSDLSMPFVCAFGRDSEGGAWAINFLLELSIMFLVNLNVEPDVVEDSVNLFISLVDNKEKGQHVLKSENLMILIMVQANLRFGIKREVIRGLTLAGVALQDPSADNEYWLQVLKPLQMKLQAIISQNDFTKSFHEEHIKTEIMDVLDCLVGVAEGSVSTTIPAVFEYISPMLSELPNLMRIYHNYQQVVELILNVLCKCAAYLISYLSNSDIKKLYQASLCTIQEYAKCNTGRLSLDSDSQDDCFTDLLLLMELLSNLFTRDIFDLSHPEIAHGGDQPIVAGDVCLYGLNLIMPLVNSELLKYPELCLQYFKLISYVCQFYPAKILQLPEHLLQTLLTSIEFGLNSYGEEIIPYCCDFLQFLATHIYGISAGGECNPILRPFLKLMLNLILTHQVNDGFLPKTSGALFSLMCCYPEEYRILVQSGLSSQSEPPVRELLAKCFNQLTENIPLKLHRLNQNNFRKNFETFVVNARGFFTTG